MARDLRYWAGRLRASAAFRLRRLMRRMSAQGSAQVAATVQSVFVAVLGRRAEPAAEAAYVAALQTGEVDVGEMVARLIASEEFAGCAPSRTEGGFVAQSRGSTELVAAVTFAESLLAARLMRDGVGLQLGPARFDELSSAVLAEKLKLLLLTLTMLSDEDRRMAAAAR